MRILSDGNVGIGTTSPDSLLTVSGSSLQNSNNAGIELSNSHNAQTVLLIENTTSRKYEVAVGGSANSIGNGSFYIYDGTAGDARLVIDSSGNVGIGTTSPDANLEIFKSSGPSLLLTAGGSGTAGFKITKGDSGTAYINNVDNVGMQFQIANGTKMTIASGGNVGIGLTNPGQKLEVAGNIKAHDGYIRSEDGSTGDFMQMFNDGANTGQSFITTSSTELVLIPQNGKLQLKGETYGSGNNASLEIYNALNTAIKVKLNSNGNSYLNGGNVGIGITNPSTKLHVVGTSRFGGSSDYIELNSSGNIKFGDTSAAILPAVNGTQTLSIGATMTGNWDTIRHYFDNEVVWNPGVLGGADDMNLDTSGNLVVGGTATATNFILSSDKTLKENIKDIDNKHIDVNWKNFELKSEPGIKRVGVIAQELETKHPEFVRTNKNGLKSVAYIDLLIAKIAELEARLEKAGI